MPSGIESCCQPSAAPTTRMRRGAFGRRDAGGLRRDAWAGSGRGRRLSVARARERECEDGRRGGGEPRVTVIGLTHHGSHPTALSRIDNPSRPRRGRGLVREIPGRSRRCSLGHAEVASLLERTLEDEKATDARLTQIAEGMVNPKAAAEPPSSDEERRGLAVPRGTPRNITRTAAPVRAAPSDRSPGRGTT